MQYVGQPCYIIQIDRQSVGLLTSKKGQKMCLIIHKPYKKRIPQDILERARRINPHGFGITYLDNGHTKRKLTYKGIDKLLKTDRPLVCHFRYATVGKINLNNVHPFNVSSRTVIYSNGTVDGFGNGHESDIAHIAKRVLPKLRKLDWKPFLELTETRFCIVDTKSLQVQRIGKWHEREGVFYSKSNCFDDPCKYRQYGFKNWTYNDNYEPKDAMNRVAVYGTLKSGYHNNHLLLDADLVGTGKLQDRYPLEVDGLPYLYPEKGVGEFVDVEVYDVDDNLLARLDRLEGHPNWYKRERVLIDLDDWSKTTAWVYFLDQPTPEGVEFTDSYTGTNTVKADPYLPDFTL